MSDYNIEIPIKDNHLIVFNSISGAILKLSRQAYTIENAMLIKHKFVVPKNVNEIDLYKYRYLAAIYATQSWHFTIAPTMRCNFNCPYCFEGSNKGGRIMTKAVINSVKTFLKSKSDKPIAITWFGGEPFLGWKAISDITQFLLSENIAFYATAITNGSVCSEEIIQNIDTYRIKHLQVTLDGTRNQHDSKRIFKTGKPSFDLLIENIHRFLNNTNVKISIRINIDKSNIDSFRELRGFLHAEFKEFLANGRISLSPSPIKNRTEFSGCSNCLSIDEYYDFEHNNFPSKKHLPFHRGPCSLRCMSSIGIGSDGNIYKCLEHFGDPSKSIGSILTSMVDLQKEAKYAVGVLPFDVEECKSCKLLPACGGGCAIDLAKSVENKYTPSCTINYRLLKSQILHYYNIDE
ncbi:MAG: radical SAM protein [Muribaculaceae bacterium]|nr:radical SAM protein [Muribaculaceae bacterium]